MSEPSFTHGRDTTLGAAVRGSGRIAFLLALAAFSSSGTALAQTFPAESGWTPLERIDPDTQVRTAIGDVVGDSQNARDIVGDANNPAAYVASDANFYYFRLRVNASVLQNATNFAPFAWGCVIDSDGVLSSYEYSTIVNGVSNPDQVGVWKNSVQSTPNDPGDAPDQPALVIYTDPLNPSSPFAGYAREAPATSTFGGNPDVFIDWAVQRSVLVTAGLADGTAIRVACATGSNGQTLSGDFTGTPSLPLLLSEAIICSGTGCVQGCDGAGAPCTAGIGECAVTGVTICQGSTAVCGATPGTPSAEICDGKDNDCDGTSDEGNPGGGALCSTALPGVCGAGTTFCANGALACVPDIVPGSQPELCNGLDDDCDGTTDEGFNVGAACTAGLGACQTSGVLQCSGGAAVCNAVPNQPGTEVCGNAIDEDCDGALDNGCGCVADTGCGSANDGSICDLLGTFQCIAGCRGDNSGNGCPTGQFCTSTDATPGSCVGCLVDLDCGGTDSGTVCLTPSHVCANGCRGIDGNACPSSLTCTSNDATVGACVECVLDADCGDATSGTICNAATNSCIAGCRGTGGNGCATGTVCTSADDTAGQCVGCLADPDCGDTVSGKVCDAVSSTCIEGCRATGNGCPDTFLCTSSDDTVGQCIGCLLDADCGGNNSGRICDADTSLCIDGCRGTGGNSCAPQLNCTSTDASPGQCVGCTADGQCGDNVSGKVCDDVSTQCINGCRGTGNGCPATFTCTSTDATLGQCVVCFTDPDCGTDVGKICAPDGTCIDGCREGAGCPAGEQCTTTGQTVGQCVQCVADSDCGSGTSGRVCDAEGACIDGCRGTGGNDCPDGQVCSSVDDTLGTCSSAEGGVGGAAGSGGSGAGGAAGKGGSAGTGGSAGKAGSAGSGGSAGKGGSAGTAGAAGSDAGTGQPEAQPGSLEGGGCGCATPASSSPRAPIALLLAGIAAMVSRRRRIR